MPGGKKNGANRNAAISRPNAHGLQRGKNPKKNRGMLLWFILFLFAALIVGYVHKSQTQKELHYRKLDRIQKELKRRGADDWTLRHKKPNTNEEE